jgi:hypothetical protein
MAASSSETKSDLDMPNGWTKPSKALNPDPEVEIGFRRADFSCVKYLCDGAKDFFLDIGDGEISTKLKFRELGSNKLSTTVAYTNGLWWVVVHPSAKRTIDSLDEQFIAGRYINRVIFPIPKDVLDTPDYWTP